MKPPMKTISLALLLWASQLATDSLAQSPGDWASALAKMPLPINATRLNENNCTELMLCALQSNLVVKGLIFMPGAVDELYFFRRASALLTNSAPSLLDAVSALTNQTHIRATFQPPLLLLHSSEDILGRRSLISDTATALDLYQHRKVSRMLFNDDDWDHLQPILKWTLKLDVRPWHDSRDSWHFYRHTLAAWNLTGWETLQAVALAGKTRFTVRSKQVIFELDTRFRDVPKLQTTRTRSARARD
jgi:hypothetical protein